MSEASIPCRSSNKLSYVPSSWNYGSFHPCNPFYNRKVSKKDDKNGELKRSNSVNLNRFGKRKLQEEEKIVTNDYLKTMKELKTIKNVNVKNTNSHKSASSSNRQNSDITTEQPMESENEGSLLKRMNSSKKSFKYQLSYDEWVAVKSKEQELFNNIKLIKEKEDENYEHFNLKINENYNIVKEQAYKEWLEKKNNDKLREIEIKKQIEEQKNSEKLRKQQANEESIENWIKRQAEALEIQNRIKKMKEEIIKQEQFEVQKRDEIRKIQADEAFRTWVKKKPSVKITQNDNSKKENNIKRSFYLNRSKPKIIIGPYTNAKELKEIQKKINLYHESAYANNSDNMKRESYLDEDDYNEKDETNKKIEDSLHDLSSIKRENLEHEDY